MVIDLVNFYRRPTAGHPDCASPSGGCRLDWPCSGLIALLAGLSIAVVPAGMAGVRVSQISGTLPDTLYPGLHLVVPLVQSVETYDLRDQIYETTMLPDSKKGE